MKKRKYKKINILKAITSYGVFSTFFALSVVVTLAFSEPSGLPGIEEPADANSTGQIETVVGTPASVSTGTDDIFNYLRLIDTAIGGTPASTSASSSDDGTLINLIGTNGALANGQTIFNYLKKINDNLDFPTLANTLASDTVKGDAGSIANCTDNDGGTCYISQANKSLLDTDLTAGNIATGIEIFGVTGTTGAANCSSAGEQDCNASDTWYGGTLQTVASTTVSQSAGYYSAFDLETIDLDLRPGNIASGVVIFGVIGTADFLSEPSFPQSLSITGVANGQINLSWSAPANNGGTGVTGYKIYRGTSSGSKSLITTVGAVTTHSDSTASNNTTYYYEVTATNSVGESVASNEVSGVVRDCYSDSDGDGWGAGSAQAYSLNSCSSPYVNSSTDCLPSNANVHPGVTAYSSTDRGDGSYDWNCNGTEDKRWTSVASASSCTSNRSQMDSTADLWFSGTSAPACGSNGTYAGLCYHYSGSCSGFLGSNSSCNSTYNGNSASTWWRSSETRTQECR